MNASPPLLITLGEPAGIGPDCVLLAHQNDASIFANSIVVAPAQWLSLRAQELNIDINIQESPNLGTSSEKPNTLTCWNPLTSDIAAITAGETSAHSAMAVIACIKAAALACLHGQASAMTTGPIEKAILRDAGFNFPGHTEYLAHLGHDCDIVMMLASKQLRVALLTTHLAIQDVPAALSIAQTLQCLKITHADLKQRFNIAHPRLGLCGLNPHAGEQGHFGRQEIELLMPAVKLAREQGLNVSDPLPADTLFSASMRHNFDAIVCCYHDQALIPIKALSFGDAVNVTLGLPFIRTSVDHGTALDRAGTGKVSYSSLVEAIQLAHFMRENLSIRS